MKTATRITGIYLLLIVLLVIIGSIDSASWCSGACDTVSYFGALAFLFFIYPGMTVTEQLVPYNHSVPLPIYIWVAAAIATGAMLFITIFVLKTLFTQGSRE